MARTSVKPIQEDIEGSFLDVVIPNFDWVKVKLVHKKTNWTNTKTKEITKVDDNFSIIIDVTENLPSEDKDLSLKIQEVTRLPFSPYNWSERYYRFYTTERTGAIEDKKQILEGLLNLLKKYELDKKAQFSESSNIFKEDLKQNLKFESVDMLMKVHEPTQRFVVLTKDHLGKDKYSLYLLLKKSSEYSSRLCLPEHVSPSNINKYVLSTDFFKEDFPGKKLEGKTYFFVNPSFYEEVKHAFKFAEKEHKEFLEKQKKVSAEHDLSQYNIETDNVFGLKIKFIEEHQCFEFYGKGYFENESYEGYIAPRGLLGVWALNLIYSEEESDVNKGMGRDMFLQRSKIELEEVKGGSKREKNVRIPASEWPKLKKIKENFESECKIWGRTEKPIKITHCDFSGLGVFERFPAVYFNNKGETFLAFGSRRTGVFKAIGQNAVYGADLLDDFNFNSTSNPVMNSAVSTSDINSLDNIIIETNNVEKVKKPRQVKFGITMKTIPISFEEAKYFPNEHPFADHIKHGTFELNVKLHGSSEPSYLTHEEKNEIFNKVYLHAELHAQTKKHDEEKPKTKRLKL